MQVIKVIRKLGGRRHFSVSEGSTAAQTAASIASATTLSKEATDNNIFQQADYYVEDSLLHRDIAS